MSRSVQIGVGLVTLLLAVVGVHVLRLQLTPIPDACQAPEALRDLPIFHRAHHFEQTTDPQRARLMQWTEGAFKKVGGGDQKLRFRLIRTDDLAPFFGPPLGFIPSITMPSDERRLEWLEIDGEEIPVHIRINRSFHTNFFVAYIYALGNQPVAWPDEAALWRALSNPLAPPEPLSMLIGESTLDKQIIMNDRRRATMAWVADAWREFSTACGS